MVIPGFGLCVRWSNGEPLTCAASPVMVTHSQGGGVSVGVGMLCV